MPLSAARGLAVFGAAAVPETATADAHQPYVFCGDVTVSQEA